MSKLFARDLSGAADRQAGAGEGVPTDEAGGQAKFATQRAHLVLEQLAQGFDQFQAHLLGQAADVVVAFDRDRWPAREADAFDYVRVEGALGEEFRAAQPRPRVSGTRR